jgi:uncharacterized membrane protein YheB (UPF0754 family)
MNSMANRVINLVAPYLILIVFICLATLLVGSLYGMIFPYSTIIIQVLLGGFIGGITNKIAIKMLFEKKWFLPGSGVLLKKHQEIIHSLARTVETHLVNSTMIQGELRKLLRPVKIAKVEKILNSIVDEFRDDIREYLGSSAAHHEIQEALKTKLGFLGRFLNVTRIKEYEEMTDTIITELDSRLSRLRISRQMIVKITQKIGTLEDFLFMPKNDLLIRHYRTDKSIAEVLFDKIDIKRMVIDKLSAYEPSAVKDIIEENIRSHLLWLEVFGVLLGMLFAGSLILAMMIFRA